jgi:DNA-binding NarL/FixJ family response regulator
MTFTPRNIAVVQSLWNNGCRQKVADEFLIDVKTVDWHLLKVMRVVHVNSDLALCRRLLRMKVIKL